MLKKPVRKLLSQAYSNFDYPIIVNSYGRSGSTVLTKSIIESAVQYAPKPFRQTVFRAISDSPWRLDYSDLIGGIVYKTHDYPPKKVFREDIRMIYTFSNPVDVVQSLLRLYEERGESWMREHYQHLRASYQNFEDIIIEDNLHLENHLDSWLNEPRFPIAFIKYESMWGVQEEISKFLGFDIELPPYRERKAKERLDKKIESSIYSTYLPLQKKIDQLEPFFVNEPK